MLALETEAGWQLIEQVDHARLSGALACAWGAGEFAPASEPLRTASGRHDEGWAVWDSHPSATADGRPMSFLDARPSSLLSAYAACVDALAEEDAQAALLVSLHVCGLRRGRFGLAPDSASRARAHASGRRASDPRVDAFLAAEQARRRDLRADLEGGGLAAADMTDLSSERGRFEYAQLQLFDVLSLELGLNDLSRSGSERVLDLAPTAAGRPDAPVTLRLLGSDRVAVSPWPFVLDSVVLRLPRRLLRTSRFAGAAELRQQWERAEREALTIELIPAGT